MLERFADWLTLTALHDFLSDTTRISTWLIIPLSQSIHILAVSAVMLSVAMINLRLFGIGGKAESFAQLVRELTPWLWAAIGVLLFTGVVQTIAEPTRELASMAFRTKMILLIAVLSITALYQATVRRDPKFWLRSDGRRQVSKILASTSLMLWIGIAAAGRLIAYVA